MQALKLARKYPNFSQGEMMQLVEQFKSVLVLVLTPAPPRTRIAHCTPSRRAARSAWFDELWRRDRRSQTGAAGAPQEGETTSTSSASSGFQPLPSYSPLEASGRLGIAMIAINGLSSPRSDHRRPRTWVRRGGAAPRRSGFRHHPNTRAPM